MDEMSERMKQVRIQWMQEDLNNYIYLYKIAKHKNNEVEAKRIKKRYIIPTQSKLKALGVIDESKKSFIK